MGAWLGHEIQRYFSRDTPKTYFSNQQSELFWGRKEICKLIEKLCIELVDFPVQRTCGGVPIKKPVTVSRSGFEAATAFNQKTMRAPKRKVRPRTS